MGRYRQTTNNETDRDTSQKMSLPHRNDGQKLYDGSSVRLDRTRTISPFPSAKQMTTSDGRKDQRTRSDNAYIVFLSTLKFYLS